jgi:predicted O-linked N-acetylglucosamine transferase (SPINDLY family)
MRTHAVASLIVGCFEHHDKERFETTAISLSAGDGSETRRRMEAAFDHFIDVHEMSDAAVAALLREREIDIAIDLNGYTGDARSGILAHRPAPVQVNYLGYPGTMGAPYMDYIIADPTVLPDPNRIHYSEQVVYLPNAYQANDRKRRIAERTPTRVEAGLPQTGFVFACFNNTHKIGPEMFDIWMRLLGDVKDSVLWLFEDNAQAAQNLKREAVARGVDAQRLVFAPRVMPPDHLARTRLADLFLDTLPYNAHTTASDALWMGLPVLTCPGESFPARVAASLLSAIGMPELVTSSLGEYEMMARLLAGDPQRLAAIKAKLIANRDIEPMFNTAQFTRYLESAYTGMYERQRAGLPPEGFAVHAETP